ncbi:MAG: cardiolipin synthase [Novosphingobium sp.]|jgi:cardiolipin synthase|nr:cardiolipin synthase [Novosphingobium sp.]
MSNHLETLWYVTEWVVRIGALLIVPQRRSANATRAWLLLIFFLPIPGLLLYLLIGSPRFPEWRKERFASLVPYFRDTASSLAEKSPELGDKAAIAELADDLGRMPATSGNTVELIDVYDDVFDRLEQDIDGAKRFVHILVYIFADDHVGQRIAQALGRAFARGVEVRVMFDPVGTHRWRKGTLAMLRGQGVDVREALPWRIFRDRSRGDMRDHRKLFVIDGHIGYAGSQNLVAKDFRPGVVNHELVARVTGPAVAEMEAIVRGDWCLETGVMPDQPIRVPDATGSAVVQLLPSGADYRLEGFESLLVWQIHQATRRVVLVTPYFIPDESLLGAVRTAVARGVDVHIVLSEVVDQRLVNLSQSSYYEGLLVAGVRIHLYRGFLLHAKNVGIDSRLAIVGSSNVDLRSFQLNEEASLLLYDEESIARVDAIQNGYLAASDPVILETWRNRPWTRRFAENIARLFNSLL